MNRIILLAAMVLIFVSTAMTRVWIIVDEDYLEHDMQQPEPDGHKLVRYMREVMEEEAIKAYLFAFEKLPGNDCYYLWNLLSGKYEEYHSDPDPLEGVILVGNIPVPTFHYGDLTIACEYFYMDLWDSSPANDCPYPDWEFPNGPWQKMPGEYYILNRNVYEGDEELEIWVSRIYATNLNYLRADGASWGEFLEEYEIIDAYFDKVHERMTTAAPATRRGVAIGKPPENYFPPLRTMSAMDNLIQTDILDGVDYFDNLSDLRLNQAAAWQALLQAGRPGNINYGSFQGNPFTSKVYERACETGLAGGFYEWAAVYAHSSHLFHGFHEYYNSGYDAGGGFFSVNEAPSWTEHSSGGFNNGKYYVWDNEPVPHSIAEWSTIIPKGKGGLYEIHMYWKASPSNSRNSWYYLHAGKNFYKIFDDRLDQTVSSPDHWHFINDFNADEFDTLVFVMDPNNAGYDGLCIADAVDFRLVLANPWAIGVEYETGDFVSYNGVNYKCVYAHRSQVDWYPGAVWFWEEDTYRLRVTPGNLAPVWNPNGVYYQVDECVSYNDINYRCIQAHTSQHDWKPPIVPALWQLDTSRAVTPNDLFDISHRGNGGFRLKNWYNRSFCDMQDEPGGQSKVLFFEGIACKICNYYEPDNLGLLYGMGHAGLIMLGNSYDNSAGNDYTEYTERLRDGDSFGEAYLFYANRDFRLRHFNDNFILFGAGTLKTKSYR